MPDATDLDRKSKELDLKNKELEQQLKQQELVNKKEEHEQKQKTRWYSHWNTPVGVALVAAILGVIGTLVNAYLSRDDEKTRHSQQLELETTKNSQQMELERQKREGTLILEAIKTDGRPKQEERTAANLVFLAEHGLINLDKAKLEELKKKAGATLPGVPTGGPTIAPSQEPTNPGTPIQDTTKSPWNAICKLFTKGPDGSPQQACGVLIAPRVVLTAVISVRVDGKPVQSVTVVPGMNGSNKPYGEMTVTAEMIRWPKELDGQEYGAAWLKNSYAVILLPDEFKGVTPLKFDSTVGVKGLLPVTLFAAHNEKNAIWRVPVKVTDVSDGAVSFKGATGQAMGGGPLLVEDGKDYKVCGLLVWVILSAPDVGPTPFDLRQGPVITDAVAEQLKKWIEESEKLPKK